MSDDTLTGDGVDIPPLQNGPDGSRLYVADDQPAPPIDGETLFVDGFAGHRELRATLRAMAAADRDNAQLEALLDGVPQHSDLLSSQHFNALLDKLVGAVGAQSIEAEMHQSREATIVLACPDEDDPRAQVTGLRDVLNVFMDVLADSDAPLSSRADAAVASSRPCVNMAVESLAKICAVVELKPELLDQAAVRAADVAARRGEIRPI